MVRQAGLIFIGLLVILINFYPIKQKESPLYQNEVAILVYHHIDDTNAGPVTITSNLFRGQLSDLLHRGYHFITLNQLKDFLSGTAPVPDNAVLVTFDDGYESFYTKAYPILHELHIPAVNFVITKDLENPGATAIPSLSSGEISQMVSENEQLDFQCHSDQLHEEVQGKALLTHKMMVNGSLETEEDYHSRIIQDTLRCIHKLQALEPYAEDAYAYPFGSYDTASETLLMQSGIRYGFTTTSGMVTNKTDWMQLPRINAGSPFVKPISVNNLIIRNLHKKSI